VVAYQREPSEKEMDDSPERERERKLLMGQQFSGHC
jgi:hypothetical protein